MLAEIDVLLVDLHVVHLFLFRAGACEVKASCLCLVCIQYFLQLFVFWAFLLHCGECSEKQDTDHTHIISFTVRLHCFHHKLSSRDRQGGLYSSHRGPTATATWAGHRQPVAQRSVVCRQPCTELAVYCNARQVRLVEGGGAGLRVGAAVSVFKSSKICHILRSVSFFKNILITICSQPNEWLKHIIPKEPYCCPARSICGPGAPPRPWTTDREAAFTTVNYTKTTFSNTQISLPAFVKHQ